MTIGNIIENFDDKYFNIIQDKIITICQNNHSIEFPSYNRITKVFNDLKSNILYDEPSQFIIKPSDNEFGLNIFDGEVKIDGSLLTNSEWTVTEISPIIYLNTPISEMLAKILLLICYTCVSEKEKAKYWRQQSSGYIEEYKYDCNKIANLFCKKHDFYEIDDKDTYWIADKVGEILAVGDFYFDMKDIITDLNNEYEEDALLQWYDYCLEDKKPKYNYENWYKIVYKNGGHN